MLIEFQFTAFNDYPAIDVKGIKKFSKFSAPTIAFLAF